MRLKKFNIRKNKLPLFKTTPYIVLFIVLGLSIAYSSFASNMNLSGLLTTVRIKKDVRITGVSIAEEESICKLVDDADGDGEISPGDEYLCAVEEGMDLKNDEGYTFFVLPGQNADGPINLIMYTIINASGQPVDSNDVEDKGFVAWSADGSNANGPVTAMAYLDEATSSWKEELRLNETYTDEGGRYGTITLNGKARLPKLSEVSDLDGTNDYLYEYMGEYLTSVSGVTGYWTLASYADFFAYAMVVNGYHGTVSNYYVDGYNLDSDNYGVRPVITVERSEIETKEEEEEPESICTLADDSEVTGTNTGAKYLCKVKDEMEEEYSEGYPFYVLGNNLDGTTNLIMFANINASGQPVDSDDVEDTGEVAWSEDNSNANGPVTVMPYLDQATSSWKEELRLNETYTDEGGVYGTITLNGKARLPKLSEVSEYDEETGVNLYLYDYMGHGFGYDISGHNVTGVAGYWTLATDPDDPTYAWGVESTGWLINNPVSNNETAYGVRPVITVQL